MFSVCVFSPRIVVTENGSNGVAHFDGDGFTLLVQYFDAMLISEFRDAVSNNATGDCILTRLLDASSIGVLGL